MKLYVETVKYLLQTHEEEKVLHFTDAIYHFYTAWTLAMCVLHQKGLGDYDDAAIAKRNQLILAYRFQPSPKLRLEIEELMNADMAMMTKFLEEYKEYEQTDKIQLDTDMRDHPLAILIGIGEKKL